MDDDMYLPNGDKKGNEWEKEWEKVSQDDTSSTKGLHSPETPVTTSSSYEDIFRQLNTYTPPTKEEIEKERKKYKRNQVFNAIGDGIQALSNLFFTTQYAPNAYDGKNSMSEQAQIRYDKLLKERQDNNKLYYDGLIRAKAADDQKGHQDRMWQRTLDIDAYNKDRDKVKDDQWQKQYDRQGKWHDDERADKKAQQDRQQSNWEAELAYRKANDAANRAQRKAELDENRKAREEARNRSTATARRGNRLAFSDANGNEIPMWETVWKSNMPYVYRVLYEDGIGRDSTWTDTRYKMEMEKKTNAEKEAFVKANWYKSERAKAIMYGYSQMDPATMESTITGDSGSSSGSSSPEGSAFGGGESENPYDELI